MLKKSFKVLTAVFILSVVFVVAKISLAATPDVGLQFGASIGLSSADPRVIASRIIQIFLGFLGIIAVGLIVYAGFLWMTAAGNEEKIDKAKKTLVSAIIGLVIILSSFAIATFILNKLLAAIGGGNINGEGGGNPVVSISGAGVIGVCSVENVYPVPNQKEVARNTAIIITFKEDVDPATICTTVSNNQCQGSFIKISNVKIYKSNDDPAVDTNLLTDIQVFNTDKKTFTFVPKTYLGSPSEYLWYTVHLDNKINRANVATSIFDSCRPNYLDWQFEVSNKIDLTPPQVVNNGVFPPPDNIRDNIVSTLAKQAGGSITVNSGPKVYKAASVTSVVPLNSGHTATVTLDSNYDQGGVLILTVSERNGSLSAELKKGDVSLGAPSFDGKAISFPGLALTADKDIVPGDQWTINVKAVTSPDTLTVGSITYTFVANNPSPNQIVVGDKNTTAANITAALNTLSPEVVAVAAANKVNITASRAGIAGNNIILSSSNSGVGGALGLSGASLSGGFDGSTTVAQDQPRNSIIQINFNEPIFPNNVAGDASLASNAIHIVNAESSAKNGVVCSVNADCQSYKCEAGRCRGDYLAGTFTIANQYKTVEFISDNECGVNGCGEKIYCLPEKSNLRVKIMAASLSAVCNTGNDCSAKSPYNNCVKNLCHSTVDGNFPQGSASAADGVMDLSLNSLDGNRNSQTEGPVSFYDQNNSSGQSVGDNFSWSFFISDKMDITPPLIKSTAPNKDATIAGLLADLEITFTKIMMASSLKTGSTLSNNGKIDVVHKNINIWNLADKPVGYWIESNLLLVGGSPNNTQVLIKHSDFSESMSYRAQVGSGVRDIFQNCFKPSVGPACSGVNDNNPSCCNGSAVNVLDSDGNCP